MSYSDIERKKQIGMFNNDRGTVYVNIVYVEKSVYNGSNREQVLVPVSFELFVNGMEVRIKAEDLRGFVGLTSGSAEEFQRSRDIVMRRLERMGVNLEEIP